MVVRKSAPQRDEDAHRQHAPASPHQHPEHQRVLDLQRRIGNRAVAGMLTPVQRASRDTGDSVMERDDEMELEAQYGVVVSGHGRFNENHLAAQRRKKSPTFEVPPGMTVIMYAPPGAAMDDRVGHRIENADPPRADELELVDPNSKVVPMPAGYPWRFTAGQQVIDYTVTPPDRLQIEGTLDHRRRTDPAAHVGRAGGGRRARQGPLRLLQRRLVRQRRLQVPVHPHRSLRAPEESRLGPGAKSVGAVRHRP